MERTEVIELPNRENRSERKKSINTSEYKKRKHNQTNINESKK